MQRLTPRERTTEPLAEQLVEGITYERAYRTTRTPSSETVKKDT